LNNKRKVTRFTFTLLFLALLAFTSSLATAEVITYDYDNAGQVKKVIYGNGATMEYTYDNSGNMTTKTVTLLKPIISASPESLAFGNVHIGNTSAPQTITITNAGTLNLAIGTVTLTGANPPEFLKQSDNCSGTNKAPSETCQIQIAFRPNTTAAKTANLSITSNDPDTPTLNIPLSGTGTVTLTVVKNGTGSGTVTSSPPGIDCSSDCTEQYGGTSVTLTATPNAASCSTFAGWSGGGCSGTGNCSLTMTADTTVTATFNTPPPVANFSGSPVTGPLPLTVYFNDLSSSCPTSWYWTFGDGTTSTLQNPGHTYNYLPGKYTVTLTAANAGGASVPYSRTEFINLTCGNSRAKIVFGDQLFPTIQAAYDAAINGDTILTLAEVYTEDLYLDDNKSVTIKGGYVCPYTNQVGETVVVGNVVVGGPNVTADKNVTMERFHIQVTQ